MILKPDRPILALITGHWLFSTGVRHNWKRLHEIADRVEHVGARMWSIFFLVIPSNFQPGTFSHTL